jgi:hypothetical protein
VPPQQKKNHGGLSTQNRTLTSCHPQKRQFQKNDRLQINHGRVIQSLAKEKFVRLKVLTFVSLLSCRYLIVS